MSCRACESRLELYLEGGLDVYALAAVNRHLARCPSCRAALKELRAVEITLNEHARAALLDPAPNFTFAVMANVRAMPQPHVQPALRWALLGWYLAAAWVLIGVLAVAARPLLLQALAGIAQAGGAALSAVEAIVGAVAAITGGHGAVIAVIVGAILAVDAVLAAGVYLIHAQVEQA